MSLTHLYSLNIQFRVIDTSLFIEYTMPCHWHIVIHWIIILYSMTIDQELHSEVIWWSTRQTLSFEKQTDPRIMCMWLIHKPRSRGNHPLVSYHEALPCNNNRITDPKQAKRNNTLVSYDEPLTCTDNTISKGKTLGELRRGTDSNRWQDQWSKQSHLSY